MDLSSFRQEEEDLEVAAGQAEEVVLAEVSEDSEVEVPEEEERVAAGKDRSKANDIKKPRVVRGFNLQSIKIYLVVCCLM